MNSASPELRKQHEWQTLILNLRDRLLIGISGWLRRKPSDDAMAMILDFLVLIYVSYVAISTYVWVLTALVLLLCKNPFGVLSLY